MCIAVVPVILFVFANTDELRQALETLRSTTASYRAVSDACRTVAESQANDEPGVIRALLPIWTDSGERPRATRLRVAELVCKKSGDRTAPIIIQAARKLLESEDSDARGRGALFFQAPGVALSGRLTDPEPVLKLAGDYGCLAFIARSECSPELRDRYLIAALRSRKSLRADGLLSIFCHVSDEAIPKIRRVVKQLNNEAPQSIGFDVAIRTLVDAEDIEILPLLKAMFESGRYNQKQREMARVYVAKLRFQHSKQELVRLLRSEREHREVLRWAVWRLLWLKADKATIRAALREKRVLGPDGRDLAREIEALFFEDLDHLDSGSRRWHGDILMLARDDLRRRCANMANDPLEMLSDRYSLPELLKAAPNGE